MQRDYYFHLQHKLKNLKVFENIQSLKVFTMCPGMGNLTSSLPII